MDWFQIGIVVLSVAIGVIAMSGAQVTGRLIKAEKKIALLFQQSNRITDLEMKVSDLERKLDGTYGK